MNYDEKLIGKRVLCRTIERGVLETVILEFAPKKEYVKLAAGNNWNWTDLTLITLLDVFEDAKKEEKKVEEVKK